MPINAQNITFKYENQILLDGISFSIASGEIATLIGVSGSGKSTILQMLNGLVKPDSGTLKGCGSTSFMMQDHMLLAWRTVLQNITLPGELGKKRADLKKQALELIEELGLSGYENHYPNELSGGMQQRVSLGRALLLKKPILLLDEPFSSLDVILREQLYELLKKVRDRYGITILMVTHDFHDALALSDKILLLKEGKIKQEWSVAEYQHNPLSLLTDVRQAFDK